MMPPADDGTARRDEDAALIDALRRGEPRAVEELVQAYGPRIHRRAIRILGNHADAEEAAQDALLGIVRRIQLFGGRAAFATWVYRVATNAALGRLRRRRPVDGSIDGQAVSEALGDHAAGADEELGRHELGWMLGRAINTLPEAYRLALVLRHLEGLSHVAIARRLGLSLAAVKSRVHRARLLVRHRLAAYVTA